MSKILSKGLTFDDVLLVPAYSEVTPDVVDVTAWLTPSISLNIPLVSAAMDTVTESAMAISMARAGGIGIVHKNMSIERQKLEIEKVKKSESGMIIDPITVEPDDTVEHALDLMHAYRVSGLPVVREKKLVGILTNRDVRFVEDLAGTKVRDVMTSENLITVPTGTTLEEAKHHLHTHRIEKLLVVDEKGELAGLLTMKDIDKVQKYPNACKDSKGRLRVGAAIGVGPEGEKRAAALIAAGVDVLVLDSAHGHSKNILDAVSAIKGAFPDCQLVAGNVATYEGARAMLKDAPIVILDEATASVDADNESYIQQAISELVQGKTLLVIAHRLSTIQNADQIVVLEKGHIVDQGTQAELLRRCLLYQKLWQAHIGAQGWAVTSGAKEGQ